MIKHCNFNQSDLENFVHRSINSFILKCDFCLLSVEHIYKFISLDTDKYYESAWRFFGKEAVRSEIKRQLEAFNRYCEMNLSAIKEVR